jgi:peptide chain release factor 1
MDYLDKIREIKDRYLKINEELMNPEIVSDQTKFVKLSKERRDLSEIVAAYDEYLDVVKNLDESKEILESSDDSELKQLAESELLTLTNKKNELEEKIKILLIPKDPDDEKNAILEIRAGTGGDEAGLFASDLMRMYIRYAEKKNWRVELMDINEASLGAVREVVMMIRGNNVYGELKYESGVHRVQRVPLTEASGRIHTSAASVAVLPEIEDIGEIQIDPNEVRIDVFRSGGAGGQNVNKVETAIRVTHIPTGLVVQCQDERSQLKNRQKALKVLASRLYDLKLREHNDGIAAQRKSMVKSGDRSDKIRTYNFPQNRVTDHRIGLTLYNLSNIIEGDIGGLIEALQLADRAEKMKGD